MPKSASWLPRLYEINRSIINSVRSHYGRQDLEQLFELQPRAAQKLLDMLPTVQIGTSRLVEREPLGAFLERVRLADNTTTLFEQMRKENAQSSRRKLRLLVGCDLDPVDFSSVPESTTLSPGLLEVRFRTIEDLGESMLLLARLLTDKPDQFANAYELKDVRENSESDDEMQALYRELESLKAASKIRSSR